MNVCAILGATFLIVLIEKHETKETPEDKEQLKSETNIDQKFILILLIFIINYIFKKNVIITISSYSWWFRSWIKVSNLLKNLLKILGIKLKISNLHQQMVLTVEKE